MNYSKRSWIETWKTNPATFKTFCTWEVCNEVLRKCGITESDQTEVSRITKNKTRIVNVSESQQTSFGRASEEILMRILGVGRPWRIASISIGTYPDGGDYRERPVRGEIQVDLDIERTMHACPNCGCSCKVHQYEVRHYSHPPMMGMATVLKARVPKLRCDVCDGYPQMVVPWARPLVSYTKMLERHVFLFLGSMPVCDAAEFCGVTMWAVWDMIRFRVNQALRRLDLSGVFLIYVDETSSRRATTTLR